jgi:hypothetical protein
MDRSERSRSGCIMDEGSGEGSGEVWRGVWSEACWGDVRDLISKIG